MGRLFLVLGALGMIDCLPLLFAIPVQYALAQGSGESSVEGSQQKPERFTSSSVQFENLQEGSDAVSRVQDLTAGGIHTVIVVAASSAALAKAATVFRIGSTGCFIGIPPRGEHGETFVPEIVPNGIKNKAKLVKSPGKCCAALELVRIGVVKPEVYVRPHKDTPKV
ncbi:hypothetical protein LTR91_012078 [Friedmanniomyces endolithicus]|uniref:Uncharacterized protein n=1 Tax=Friedmanniomyces endolithicus TaxID=329885 RepID=A0AAN6KGE3_9PEZI|nr:hypothetical protein LTR94_010089 [Friedmanniomyces endolithicus]KAK0814322.1 hypothetical protein LTR59_000859 [Friedmanniomyces endolithicus]KAK0870439.1 hypothetical protein LTS02_002469 [Friedmanniomyces endolithicus]KAK0906285.1 hypothetical protein LTR57_017817 [Friedmanniomyces endolithicus]KAK0909185.1 hypothetical protein LTR02_004523 [Friedmanniomyces endolithicus]